MQIISKDLTFAYNKKAEFNRQALNGVDLVIEEGDVFGIIGHTGSGKSTFIQHLNGLIKTQSGTLKVGSYDLSSGVKNKANVLKQLRSEVGMVFQYPEYQLFAETVYEDVAFGVRNFFPSYTSEQVDEAVQNALNQVGLDYNEIKNKSPFELSGGQKRRVAIAGVLVTKPKVLVLDEPVAGLDPQGKKQLMKLILNLKQNSVKTVVIVSHDLDEVTENCNKVAVFYNGKVVMCDTPKNIFNNVKELESYKLGLPITAKCTQELKKLGVEIDTNYKASDFVENIVRAYKNK
ncbi:MAG: energy-coupling factor transporter ATPase [Clostridia bacterium]|nr:energy-coupling factor transporter ATPase [Clostridia bacterium]